MNNYSKSLGEAVRNGRSRTKLSQVKLAENIGIDNRTILNIENDKGNPKYEILYRLIRELEIDPRDIFYPEVRNDTPELSRLQIIVSQCSEEEAKALIPVLQSVLNALRDENAMPIG